MVVNNDKRSNAYREALHQRLTKLRKERRAQGPSLYAKTDTQLEKDACETLHRLLKALKESQSDAERVEITANAKKLGIEPGTVLRMWQNILTERARLQKMAESQK